MTASTPDGEAPVSIREARLDDARDLVRLIAALGYQVDESGVRARLDRLVAAGLAPLIADDGRVVGCLTLSMMTVLHRPHPVGRISMLVVAEGQRGRGIGRMLVTAAEDRFRREGCGLVEVTSNVAREAAHQFYSRLGYERSSHRFFRSLIA